MPIFTFSYLLDGSFFKDFVNILETIYDYSPILIILVYILNYIWNKVFKNGPSKICGRQLLKNLKGYGLPKWKPI